MFISSSQPLEEAGAVIITVLQPEKLRPGKDESPPEVSTSTWQSPGLTHRPDAKPMLAAMPRAGLVQVVSRVPAFSPRGRMKPRWTSRG